ncbi:MAG: hypothetical protein AAGI01_10615 [Myxococcota bacterium]
MTARTAICSGFVLSALAAPALAQQAPESSIMYTLERGTLLTRDGEEVLSTLKLPCGDAASLLRDGQDLFVACAASLLQVSRRDPEAPEISGVLPLGARPIAIERVDGELLVWTSKQVVEPVPVEPLGAPTSSARTPEPEAAVSGGADEVSARRQRAAGEVRGVEGRFAVISLGRADDVLVGDPVEFYVREETKDAGLVERALGTAWVYAASADRATVELDINQRVSRGALVRRVDRKRQVGDTPVRRAAGVTEVGVLARPFLSLGDLGVGVRGAARVVHRFDAPWSLSAHLSPAQLGVSRRGASVGGDLSALIAYDADLVSFGLGVGLALDTNASDPSAPAPVHVAQSFRIGQRDGSHIRHVLRLSTASSSMGVGGGQSVAFTGVDVDAQVMASARTWVLAAGGGSVLPGSVYGELGVKRLVRGNGLEGSLFLSLMLGGAGVVVTPEEGAGEDSGFIGGVTTGVAAEWRL